VREVLKKILFVSFALVISIIYSSKVRAIDINLSDRIYEIYQIKEKEEVSLENNKVIDFLRETYDKLASLIQDKRQEEIKKIEQKKLEEKRREEILLEQRRQEILKQYQTYNRDSINSESDIVNFALQFVGNPYVSGGSSLTNGTDCSGFVMLVYANFGISLPRTASDQSYVGTAISIDNIQEGDIISYGYNGSVGHSAIYIGDGKIVHASTPELGIRVDSMYIMPIITIRRVI